MSPITFLRVRPAEAVTALMVTTRYREGTTAIEADPGDQATFDVIAEGGLLPVSAGLGEVQCAAWVVDPPRALELARSGVQGWRITISGEADWEKVLDAAARSRAAFLRVGRSQVADVARRVDLPGLAISVSVFVDSVEDAVAAVESGAKDLLLRDWDVERIGELREALAPIDLLERTALPPGVSIDEARESLPSAIFRAWLGLIDATGAARPRYRWAPGNDAELPFATERVSAQWQDASWSGASRLTGLDGSGELEPILERALEGKAPTTAEIEALLGARGRQVEAVAWVADRIRSEEVGDTVTYVVNRNINYTNLCYFRCGFCAFSKGPRSLNLRGEPYLMAIPEIVGWAREAWDRGATEVTLQGGIHPEFTGEFYVEVVKAIKNELPDIHIHGFTPLEVWQGAETLGVSVRSFLTRLHNAGLGSLPGTAAEILDDRIRRHLCPDKIRSAQWAEVMLTAHELGLKATSTIMFGHIDDPRSWANHYSVIREVQRRTGGFTEFVPLPFVHMGSPIYLRGEARPGPTWDEVVLVHAVGRIAFQGLIPNIQGSWVKLGIEGAQKLLGAGCNDLGGTLMGEIITRAAGASHGQELSVSDFESAIKAAGRVPARRDTLYNLLTTVRQG